jgi:carbonic anhydrase/acetyltransferase-like protein (isoleucine patch superfamily)
MVITHNPRAKHLSEEKAPQLATSTFVHPQAFVCGDVYIGENVFVAPFASIRADEGSPFYIDDESNVQDGVVMHALETFDEKGAQIDKHLVDVGGKKYAIYISKHVSLAHQSQVHGPSYVGPETFVGMQAFVFKSRVGKNCVIEPGAKVIGVTVADKRYVPAGMVVNTQNDADNLPEITDGYPLKELNNDVLEVNIELAKAYSKSPPN